MAVQLKMTAAEFFALPESMLPTQLIDGAMLVSPAPELTHQDVVLLVAIFLKHKAPGGKVYIAPVDVHLDDHNVPQPDILWIAPDGKAVSVEGKHLRGAPDLVVEVLSPGTSRLDKKQKFQLYEKHGVREYWMIDPAGQWLEVWSLAEEDGKRKFNLVGVFGPGDEFTSPLLGPIQVSALFPA